MKKKFTSGNLAVVFSIHPLTRIFLIRFTKKICSDSFADLSFFFTLSETVVQITKKTNA